MTKRHEQDAFGVAKKSREEVTQTLEDRSLLFNIHINLKEIFKLNLNLISIVSFHPSKTAVT
eukprot:CCRYP_012422-RB/>CCRYP_012422-RB protein AED:0.49 eAED:1.00 QI:0/0/0/1/0/0/2/0/61